FTTWLDFTQAIKQARTITKAFSRLQPQSMDIFERNLVMLEQALLDLDRQVHEIVALDPDRALVASHPVYQYFKRRYALKLESVMWEPDEVASEEGWSELSLMLKKSSAKWMLWESEPNAENIARLNSMGVESLVFNPCGNRPVAGNFLSVMQQNLRELRQSYQ
ncbi:MAG: zinc ABC transporter substrate-binding protein, partial [Gammaproteobacteria bacterium]|nr:zinc ABC transporter substrate-binding protein [Gammaproteobacteria bacterium]